MSTTVHVRQHIEILFSGLNRTAAGHALPHPGTLSIRLQDLVQKAKGDVVGVKPELTGLYATAAVEMWHRALHSFLISVCLTEASPIWASVSGYYASHYSVRGLAHLLGYFQLYRNRRIIKVEITGGKHYCHIIKKNAGDREHKFYWKTVKDDTTFSGDPFFTFNPEDQDQSDCAHRNKANYSDHVNKFPTFQILSDGFLKERIQRLSEISFSSVPVPNRQKYPDIESVQLIAYHRIVKFRGFVDGILGGTSRFWKVHRTPPWCSPFLLDFQVVEPRFIGSYLGQS